MPDSQHPSIRRRDFLLGAAAIALGGPTVVKAAVSPLGTPEAAPADAEITHAAVFPPMGFSRVGNAESWFLAPEVPGISIEPEGGYKESDGKIKKQVQRFRIYGYDDQGRVVRELTDADADITWTVRVANTKGAWYGFNNALDLGDDVPGIPGALRNQFVPLDDRERVLVIDTGDIGISGASANASGTDDQYRLAGTFWETLPVALGHLRTDDA
ncbi:MAG TPA: LodA/GoxA family CTQ-dependent oxidase, partial [Thermomicrobiales bacterium]|nr:LodA/GoxA family CTQ-dependent oxidase [Thermomicrobiales bacterium]